MAENRKGLKGLMHRLTMGKDNLPDFTPDRLPGTRWQLFKDVFFNRFGALVKVNLLTLLFCIPAIAWCVIMYMVKSVDGTMLPYSGNIGIGYPVVGDVVAIGEMREFMFNLLTYAGLIPCIVIAGLGLGGAFYVIRRLVWGEGVAVGNNFFRGIKMNWLQFIWISLIASISLFLTLTTIGMYENVQIHKAWKIISMVFSILQFVIILSMTLFMTTQAVTYKLKTWALIKNSFLFSISLAPINIFILALSAIPVILMLVLPTTIMVIVILIFVFFGLSYIMLVWTVYAHWAYDRFVNDRVEGAQKNRGMHIKTEEEKQAAKERDRKNKNIRFNNPKKKNKKISSIDEGETFTPLATTFSRADLERLAEEKENVKRSIDAEYDDAYNDDVDGETNEQSEQDNQTETNANADDNELNDTNANADVKELNDDVASEKTEETEQKE